MNKRLAAPILALAGLLLAGPAVAQLYSVPMEGLGNTWVKRLKLKGRMDWEWIETYPDRVYFATRRDATRQGDTVTMWMRVEYKEVQSPSNHYSALSKDQWDCKQKRRNNLGTFFFRHNNLDDGDPEHSTSYFKTWEVIKPGSLADTLLQFACSIYPTQQLTPPAARPGS